jgi:hypothetical protein
MRRGAALLLLCSACADPPAPLPTTFPGLVAVSESASWNSSCQGPSGRFGVVFPNAEVEPSIAIDPANPQHLIGVWQRDRWSNGGANGIVSAATFDGGQTWVRSSAKFSRCTQGAYDRATDPWVSIGPSGTAWQIAYVFDARAPNRAMLVSRSTDGGRTWQDPQQLQRDTDPDLVMDKETVTADPVDPLFAYAVWDRLTGFTIPNNRLGTGPAWFARTTDGGDSWETARQIYDPGPDTQTISNQIVVLRDGTLVDLLMVIMQNSSPTPRATVSVLRSTDRGVSWSAGIPVADAEFVGVYDPKNGRGIRTGSVVPTIAVDRANGALYIAWEDARFSGMARDGIALSKSMDGGLTWSAPVQVNGAPAVQAFTPALAVASNGSVGVTYYDLRNDDASDGDHLMVARWLATSIDGGATFTDAVIGGPFDLRPAAQVDVTSAYFLGDYQGLASAGSVFLPFFSAVPGSGPSSVFFRPAGVAPVGRGPLSVARNEAQQLWRGARERWRFGTLFK